jgi:hypothetical protein
MMGSRTCRAAKNWRSVAPGAALLRMLTCCRSNDPNAEPSAMTAKSEMITPTITIITMRK